MELIISIDDVVDEENEDADDRTEPHPDPKLVKTSSFDLANPAIDILWCGPNSEFMIVHTIKGEVYQSSDNGSTWKNKHSQRNKDEKNMIPTSHRISMIILSPVDTKIVYFIGNKGVNWVSEDCGDNLKSLNEDKKIHDFKFHPTQREWALSSKYTECTDFGEDDCDLHPEVYVTTDLGKKWIKLQSSVIQYEWGKQSNEDDTPDKQVVVVKHSDDAEETIGWNKNNKIIMSNDFFKTKKTLLAGGNYFKLTKDYLYAGKVTKKGQKILTRALKKYGYNNFYDMKISKKNLHQFDFSVIESSTGAVFLFVTRPLKQAISGNVYLSDATGTGFSLNLERVPFANSKEFDFLEIESLEGVIIANTFDSESIQTQQNADLGVGKAKKINRNQEPEVRRKTYITFNRGGTWQYLTPPEKTSKGSKIV
jgi:hypothetical protein